MLMNIIMLKEKEKGKEEYLYSAFTQRLVSKRSDMDHTVLPANFTMPVFPSYKRSPNGASTKCGGEHIMYVYMYIIKWTVCSTTTRLSHWVRYLQLDRTVHRLTECNAFQREEHATYITCDKMQFFKVVKTA